jgi:hypothetical protein
MREKKKEEETAISFVNVDKHIFNLIGYNILVIVIIYVF